MGRIFMITLLLLYYWYFYASFSKSIPMPTKGIAKTAEPYHVQLVSAGKNNFKFLVNGVKKWEHTLPLESFLFRHSQIAPRDPCHAIPDGHTVLASGSVLYEYVKNHFENTDLVPFRENNESPVQRGDVFFFSCLNGHVHKLNVCPSGSTYTLDHCQPIGQCTGQANGTLFPHTDVTRFVRCMHGKDIVETCPDGEFFQFNRCVKKKDLKYYCQFYNEPFKLNDTTLVKCRNKEPHFIRCEPGKMFFDKNYCEPIHCVGQPDGTKLPLPERKMYDFTYVPGYMTCQNGKVIEKKQCPRYFDEDLTGGENLTFLPMVFDGKQCSVPSFCENVFSDDPDTIVPAHEFTKHVKNWKFSPKYDDTVGYVCENGRKKRKPLAPGMRIGKRFKIESACDGSSQALLPISGFPDQYYDCLMHELMVCPEHSFFNGSQCVPTPEHAFKYNELPLFRFDALDTSEWIKAFDYSAKLPSVKCEQGTVHMRLYHICSHPDCTHLAYLSMIPEIALFLPREQAAKCRYYSQERHLRKEQVGNLYNFWEQRHVDEEHEESCTPGQPLKTGNFIWDSTLFATCNEREPFVFCPSTLSRQELMAVDDSHYACAPPDTNRVLFSSTEWTPFVENEILRILPSVWDGITEYKIRLNKASPEIVLPEEGVSVSRGTRINLKINYPVYLVLRYRVTYPPNVAFKYDEQSRRRTLTGPIDHGFLSKKDNFTPKSLNFPRYRSDIFVESFMNHYMLY